MQTKNDNKMDENENEDEQKKRALFRITSMDECKRFIQVWNDSSSAADAAQKLNTTTKCLNSIKSCLVTQGIHSMKSFKAGRPSKGERKKRSFKTREFVLTNLTPEQVYELNGDAIDEYFDDMVNQ